MATAARALVQRWKALDGDTQYHLIGAVLAVPCSLAVGVGTLRVWPNAVGTATTYAVLTGVATTIAWPASATALGMYGVFSIIDKRIN